VTRYGLDGLRIESWWGQNFPNPSRLSMGPTKLPAKWVPDLSPKEYSSQDVALTHSPPSIAKVNGSVELYLYSSFRPSQPLLG